MKLRTIFLLFLATLLSGVAQAQTPIPAERLMLLIAGPSGDRIDPKEQSVVFELNQFRGEHSFHALKMGSMHFDRPREAALLTNKLGLRSQAGVTLALVELSRLGVPIRSLAKYEQVSQVGLPAMRDDLVTHWARVSGSSLPSRLAHLAPSVSAPPPPTPSRPQTPPPQQESAPLPDVAPPPDTPVPPVGSTPPATLTEPSPPSDPNRQRTVYSPGGIRTISIRLADATNGVWNRFKGTAFRADQKDVPLRNLTLELAQKTNYLRQAADRGIVYPRQQLQDVLAAGRAWRSAEPELYLPPNLRSDVRRIFKLLIEVEDIEYQSRKS